MYSAYVYDFSNKYYDVTSCGKCSTLYHLCVFKSSLDGIITIVRPCNSSNDSFKCNHHNL